MLPVFLHHGIFGYDRVQIGPVRWSYFGGGIERAIAERGHPVCAACVSPLGSIATRAADLKRSILEQLEQLGRPADERIVLFAHSMGGLDARYMIAKLDMAHRVAALVTLSTPHRGSSYADWILKNIERSKFAQELLKVLRIDLDCCRDLTIDGCARFNDMIADHPDVAYFSVSASRPWHRVPPFLVHSHGVVRRKEGDNDGIVSVRSAQWGTHLSTWPADHVHMINHRLVVELRSPTGNIRPRYLAVLDHLDQAGILCGGLRRTNTS